ADCRGNGLRNPIQPKLDLGDDAKSSLGADEKPRQVVARARLPRATPGAHNAPFRGNDRESEHVLAHRSVTNGIRSPGASRRHAAYRVICAGVDGKEEAAALELRIELLARHTGLDATVEILGVDFEHSVHLREVETYAAEKRRNVTFERGAHAE